MRIIVAAFALALAACSPPSTSTSDQASTSAETSASSAAAAPAVAVTAQELGGQWSFDRTCGMYELVFTNDNASYYDYADPSHAISYVGPYTIAGNRVVLTVQRLDDHGTPGGQPITYNLDVTAPVAADLVGQFGAAGGEAHAINAKRCDSAEDRE